MTSAAFWCCGAVRKTSLVVSQGSKDQGTLRASGKVEICPVCAFACYRLVLTHLPQSSESSIEVHSDLLDCVLSVLMQEFSAEARRGKRR